MNGTTMLIHRFGPTQIIKFDSLLKDRKKLSRYITDGRRNSKDEDLNDFFSVLNNRIHEIGQILIPIRNRARTVSGGVAMQSAIMKTGNFLTTDVQDLMRGQIKSPATYKNNAFENGLLKITAVPLAKIYVFSSYDLSLHEMPSTTSKSGYAIELRMYSQEGAQVLMSSDWPITVKGPKLAIKAQPAAASV